MTQLKVIEKNGLRVLTSAQLAESFKAELKHISYNFNYNKQYYVEGKHYFVMKGEELKQYKTNHEIHEQSKHAHTLYFWTEKGAFLQAKSLNTPKAWEAYTTLLDDYFRRVDESIQQIPQPAQDLSNLSPQLQFMIQMEQRHNALEAKLTLHESNQKEIKEAVTVLTDNIIASPDHTKVVSLINEYARWTRLGHNEVYNKVYDLLKSAHGIDVRQRVNNEREKAQKEYNNKTGKWYSESTLKGRVNGIDIMVRLGCLDKFHNILSGLLAKEKIRNTLSLVR